MNKLTVIQKISAAAGALAMAAVMAPVAPAMAAMVPGGAVGPIVPSGLGKGFPVWYMDQNGLALDLMEAADGFGISDPVNPANAFSQELGFNAEGFYWSADALPVNPHGIGIVVLALESAFAGENAVDGEQSVFGRIRIRFDVGEPGTYTVRHPFGTNTYVVDTVLPGVVEINDSSDIGCFATLGVLSCDPNSPAGNPNNFSLALQSGIGPFLTWDTFNLNPALTDPALINPANPTKRYVGNPNAPHAIKGSPVNQNFVRIEGPNIGGPGVDFIQENLFTVTGRIAVIDTEAPVVVSTAPSVVTVDSTNVIVSANITDDLGARSVTIDLGSMGNALSATLQGTQEVPATASSATGSGTFTIDTAANTLSFDISYSGLVGGAETGAHIHGPAVAGVNAPILFTLPAGTSKTGVWNYPEASEADILAGRMYVNVHSVLFPNGEIRGQILPQSNVQNMVLTSGTQTNGTWGAVVPVVDRLGTFTLPITVTDGSNVSTTDLIVNVVQLTSVSVAPATASITVGATEQLTASPLDQNGAPFAGAAVTWSSSDTAVATVNTTGLVTGVAVGTTTITATATSGAITVTDTATVTVVPQPPALTSVAVSPATVRISVDGTRQLSASPLDQNGTAFAGATVAWTSSNSSVASVSASGAVTGIAAGTATITATATSGAISVSGSSAVTVTTGPACQTDADTDADGAISNAEILPYIGQWKLGNVTNLLILQAIGFWKVGAGC